MQTTLSVTINVSSHPSPQDLVKAINYKDYLAAMFKYDIYFIYYN
jgi:hypothetical protein